jgi:NADH-quinone oxidoreductase subunit C
LQLTNLSSSILGIDEQYGIVNITVDVDALIPFISFLKNDPSQDFNFLTDICGMHFPDQKLALGVVYHLHSLKRNVRIRVRIYVDVNNPDVPTLVNLFKAANWMERETYDFYGIIFTGHPDLRRILNVDDMVAFPMRKEFPLEDPNRKDKKDEYFGR